MHIGRNLLFVSLILILLIPGSAFSQGRFPGVEFQQKCRENLKTLQDATEKFLKDGGKGLPNWSTLEHVKKMILSTKYLPHELVLPTADCAYFLVYKSQEQHGWYCELHGMLEGDRKISFRYHEFQFVSKINSAYLGNEKYKNHSERLLRRVSYEPTLGENVRFHYKKNPFTTMVIVIAGLIFVYFVYKNVFGP